MREINDYIETRKKKFRKDKLEYRKTRLTEKKLIACGFKKKSLGMDYINPTYFEKDGFQIDEIQIWYVHEGETVHTMTRAAELYHEKTGKVLNYKHTNFMK